MNQSLRRVLGLPPTVEAGSGPRLVGELAGLIRAGMLAPGDRLLATAPLPDPDPVATVTDDARLRAADGTIHPGPRQLLLELRGGTFAPYGWHCLTTTDGTRLETLRQRLHTADHPNQAATGRGALTALIAAGLLAAGDQLSLPMYRHTGGPGGRGSQPIAVGTAIVTDDGCFLLPDGSRRHLDPQQRQRRPPRQPDQRLGLLDRARRITPDRPTPTPARPRPRLTNQVKHPRWDRPNRTGPVPPPRYLARCGDPPRIPGHRGTATSPHPHLYERTLIMTANTPALAGPACQCPTQSLIDTAAGHLLEAVACQATMAELPTPTAILDAIRDHAQTAAKEHELPDDETVHAWIEAVARTALAEALRLGTNIARDPSDEELTCALADIAPQTVRTAFLADAACFGARYLHAADLPDPARAATRPGRGAARRAPDRPRAS